MMATREKPGETSVGDEVFPRLFQMVKTINGLSPGDVQIECQKMSLLNEIGKLSNDVVRHDRACDIEYFIDRTMARIARRVKV